MPTEDLSVTDLLDGGESSRMVELVARRDTKITTLQTALRQVTKERDELAARLDFTGRLTAGEIKPIKWAPPQIKKPRDHRGTPVLMMSDLHLEEVVDPEEMGWVNAYNREIAEKRFDRLINNTIEVSSDYFAGLKYDGMVVLMGGDVFSGEIHEELTETNEAPLLEGVIYWQDRIAGGLEALASHFGKLHIACTYGNHGRLGKKPRAKKRPTTNIEWLLYEELSRALKSKNITWQIPRSADCLVQVYGTKMLLTHGDQFRGGSGIAGALSPLMLGAARKTKREMALGRSYDVMVVGHWHQLMMLPAKGLICNGCFTSDMEVTTPDGPKAIAKVSEGDTVMSRSGAWETVTACFEKDSEDGLVSLKVRGLPTELEATPNHLVWAMKGESNQVEPKRRRLVRGGDRPQWIPADFLSPGDWVHVPFHVGEARPFTPDLAWAYGLFLAEGHTIVNGGRTGRHHRIEFTMHIDELEVLQRAKTILDDHLGIEGRMWTRENRTTSHLSYTGEAVAAEFRAKFGHRSEGKRVPPEFYELASDLKACLVQGWVDGDGHTRPDGVTSATTVSPELANAMFDFALAAGGRPSMALIEPGGPRVRRTYTLHFNSGQESRIVNGEVFYRIHHRFRNDDVVSVFDLEVSGEHTYAVGHVGVHNSLKGYDEYAAINNFEPERAQQGYWIVTPEHGITFTAPIICQDRESEGW